MFGWEKKETRGMRRVVRAAAVAKHRLKFLYTQGKVDGTAPLSDTEGYGTAQFEIDVPDGIDQVMFYSAEDGSDYSVEYLEAKNPNGCGGSAGGSSPGAGGQSPSGSSPSPSGAGSSSSGGSVSPGSVSGPRAGVPSTGAGSSGRPAGTPATPTPGGNIYYASPGDDLGQAVSALKPGDTLYLRGGTYDHEFKGGEIPSGTSWSNPVIIAAYPGESVTIRPSGGERVFTFVNPQQYIILDGLRMDAANVDIDAVKITCTGDCSQNANYIRIQNSEIMNGKNQGILVGGTGNEFINLDVHDNGTTCFGSFHCHGIYMTGDSNLIQGSQFHDQPHGYGIHLYNGSDGTAVHDNVVTGNTVWGNSSNGMIISGGANNVASDNTIFNNQGVGIQLDYGAVNAQVDGNTIYGNGGECIANGGGSSNAVIRNNTCN
jgi:hypothetical protein